MKRVLLVDDDIDEQFLMAAAFRAHEKFDVLTTANNGFEAIDILEHLTLDKLPDIIVIDVHMPQMDGRELLIFLKAQHRYKSIPVLLYSFALQPADKEDCIRNGALDLILKPHSFSDYLEIAGAIIGRLATADEKL